MKSTRFNILLRDDQLDWLRGKAKGNLLTVAHIMRSLIDQAMEKEKPAPDYWTPDD